MPPNFGIAPFIIGPFTLLGVALLPPPEIDATWRLLRAPAISAMFDCVGDCGVGSGATARQRSCGRQKAAPAQVLTNRSCFRMSFDSPSMKRRPESDSSSIVTRGGGSGGGGAALAADAAACGGGAQQKHAAAQVQYVGCSACMLGQL